MLTDELELRVEPLAVKAVRNYPAGTAEVLIQWKDLPDFEATWESVDVMKQ